MSFNFKIYNKIIYNILPESILQYLNKNAVNFVDYLITIYGLNTQTDPGKIINIKKTIIFSISKIPDEFIREEYCKIYHTKLGLMREHYYNK